MPVRLISDKNGVKTYGVFFPRIEAAGCLGFEETIVQVNKNDKIIGIKNK